ncbi:hypothetical protein PT7_3224 [Pusillimonas sp. T7-7]|uniref:hypothetical protein n=1 Tax=Pusillimonas sp. (strain T7-7) TaxID=1007105 RepID=UPI0002084E3A|nr:hypothetical protein [Pusillimonas sp. T7-7]AEC21764.1 hypothetical protein PT7_3224 [Pusillimonas sp. T7-7]
MLITYKTHPGSAYTEIKKAMRAQFLRLSLHFLAGVLLAVFLLPEGAAIVLAAAAAAVGVKTFYDYLNGGVNVPACISLLAGAMAVLLVTA